MTTLDAWTEAVQGRVFSADSLDTAGFIHLSSPDQVAIPANALFRDAVNFWLLVIDPDRLSSPVRWEPGVGGDPVDMLFPHLFGPIDTAAVTAVVPYRKGAGDAYSAPLDLPQAGDGQARASAMERYVAAARSTSVTWSDEWCAVRNGSFPSSYDHNRVIFRALVTPADAERVCERELADLRHWQVYLEGGVTGATVAEFEAAGWSHYEDVLMIATSPPDADRVAATHGIDARRLDRAALHDFRMASMLRESPDMAPQTMQQLIDRDSTTERACRVERLAVLDGDAPVARLDLRIVGATAAIEDLMTDPAYEGRGFGTALTLAAMARARESGCDVVFLRADADDWPRHLYARLGFATSGSVHVFDRDV